MQYRRLYVKGGTYFFTLVTYERRKIFSETNSVSLLHNALRYTNDRHPFKIVAFVIMPDHLHFIWTMPDDSSDFSIRWRLIKSHFTRNYQSNENVSVSPSRKMKGERDIWQRRFWEHLIRDEQDLTRHIEYIHFNPVKHGLANSPAEWENSSFSEYVSQGLYPVYWGANEKIWIGYSSME